MDDTFWCRACQKHKKLSARSAFKKVGGALCCKACEENLEKLTQTKQAVTRDGVQFSLTPEAQRNSRVHMANRRTADTIRHLLETCPAQ